MPTLHAFCRSVSPSIDNCELSFIHREPIDAVKAQAQHDNYVIALRQMGVDVIELRAERDLPDSVFVEDVVLMFDELAVMTRPGAKSRRPEVDRILPAVKNVRAVVKHIQEPGTLDGGDVLRIGKRVYVGLSQRSNQSAIDQLSEILLPFKYQVIAVPMKECLHLKSAVTALTDQIILMNPEWLDANYFKDYRQLHVSKKEPHAANVVRLASSTSTSSVTVANSVASILMPSNFPETQAKIEGLGLKVRAVDVSELQKAEGAVTCCSVLFNN